MGRVRTNTAARRVANPIKRVSAVSRCGSKPRRLAGCNTMAHPRPRKAGYLTNPGRKGSWVRSQWARTIDQDPTAPSLACKLVGRSDSENHQGCLKLPSCSAQRVQLYK